jgi:phage host-nuclease inhibitor protein Gam
MRAQSSAARQFDPARLEGEVREVVQQNHSHVQSLDFTPRTISTAPVPDYVSHRDDVSEIGKLSAEAIVKEYEETAREIEAMGDVVKDMVQRCDQLTASASAMLKDIKATATRYRNEGKRMFAEIESCSSATDEVRRMCEAFRDKLATNEIGAVK